MSKKRSMSMLITTLLATLALAVTAAPALAEQRCKGDSNTGSNWCLDTFTEPGDVPDFHNVHVGIDVHMSLQDAQSIIDAPGNPFVARIVGSDPLADNNLFSVPLTDIRATAEFGLSADFAKTRPDGVSRIELNEDSSIFDDRDEVFARIVLTDPRTGRPRTFDTPMIIRHF